MKVRIPQQGGNQKDMMQRFQHLQEDMKTLQANLEEKEYNVGTDAVKITITGAKEVLKVTIDPDIIDPEDPEMLEDMVAAAFNQAIKAVEDDYNSEMGKLTDGLNIPGLGL